MVLKIRRCNLWNAIMLMIFMSRSCISSSASTNQINDEILDGRENATAVSQDQQVSSQYYRPYYNNRRPAYNYYNQRPSYPSRPNYRPAYVSNQRPAYSSATNNNYRPATTTTRRPNVSNNNYCTSSTPTDSNQGNWICWDQTNQKLRMGSNLTIEKLVIHYAQLTKQTKLADGKSGYNEAFRKQVCEQSRRFNNVGIVCVKYDSNASEGERHCPASTLKYPGICTAVSGMCVCVIGDQFQEIAYQNMSPEMQSNLSFFSSSFDVFSSDPFFSDTISASNLNPSSGMITASNLHQHFPSWMLPYINTQYLQP